MAHTDSNGPSLAFTDNFSRRHIGPGEGEIRDMLAALGCPSLDVLIDHTVPTGIRLRRPLALDAGRAEFEALGELRAYAAENRVARSLIGMGYYDTITPPVILRNILENPGWYTQYTPYQAEISQGRLEALINFQTMVADLTDLPLANASLLDEATAAAEAMHMCMAIRADEFDAGRRSFFVASDCHPQTIAVVQTRARPLGINVVVAPPADLLAPGGEQLAGCFGVLLQYPTTDGRIECYADLVEGVHAAGALVVAATDLLALTLFKPPGEWGADIAIGSAQRFGVPMGGGGPHAAFMSTRTEFARQMPGRIIGVSKDVHGQPAYRLAIQTREQHIRREKATSNICTAQVLLAVMASMYAVYHGPDGLRAIASRVRALTQTLRRGLLQQGHAIAEHLVFDTLRIRPANRSSAQVLAAARQRGLNLRDFGDGTIGVSLDETCDAQAVSCVLDAFADGSGGGDKCGDVAALAREARLEIPPVFERCSAYLTHPVFNAYHCEHEMLRYIKRLESRDLSLTTSNIPLGSCTMKLNAAAEMFPVSWPEFARVHPFAPHEQSLGYQRLYRDLERWLAEITGFAAVSLQPNAGSQGEYAGLLAIRAYHEEATEGGEGTQARRHAGTEGKATERRSDEATKGVESNRPRLHSTRDVCLIPVSAHGTNPASAVMAGFRVVPVKCDAGGNVDISDLRAKAAEHADRLGALMITYPSTHGVFEVGIREICEIVHEHGGQVYMDGANMNAQVGLCRPGDIGADVCHLNLHKTFCIPHGGGGPGMGPIAVAAHLAPFLPGHLVNEECRMQSAEWDAVRQNAEARPSRRDAQSPAAGADENCSSAGDASAFCIDHSAFPVGPVSAAPYGSPSILPISWMYIRMMGAEGLTRATQVAILNANYMASRLEQHYPVLYKGREGRVAHEFIIDCRAFEKSADVKVEDIAKRLMDYGFHAPTMSFPVPGTLMIEPTESESKAELDRLCDALIAIRGEIRDIEEGRLDRRDNPLKNAPHTAAAVTADHWPHAYSRQQAAYPAPWTRQHKFWPAVGRIDNVYGDRNLFCTCVPVENG